MLKFIPVIACGLMLQPVAEAHTSRYPPRELKEMLVYWLAESGLSALAATIRQTAGDPSSRTVREARSFPSVTVADPAVIFASADGFGGRLPRSTRCLVMVR
ncbi:hypothetical protein GCM10010381_36050 [Streptomyces xantholiticus]|nr:hypothetical protein GCM10010381_36050 [Streptomyces xantholiticus]